MSWRDVSSTELLSVESSTELGTVIPSVPAVYQWRRHFKPPRNPRDFERWLVNELGRPVSVGQAQVQHFLSFQAFGLGGYELSREKRKDLRKLLRSPKQFQSMRQYVLSLAPFLPVVYFGETNDLVQRTWQHLTGETGFGAGVVEEKTLSWESLTLHFYPFESHDPLALEGPQKRKRALLEAIGTIATLSPAVQRIG